MPTFEETLDWSYPTRDPVRTDTPVPPSSHAASLSFTLRVIESGSVGADGSPTIVRLEGDLDAFTMTTVRTRLAAAIEAFERRFLILDMVNVAFLDSSALHGLVTVRYQIASVSGTLALVGLSPQVQRTLAITQLAKIFMICATVEEARQQIREAQSVRQEPGFPKRPTA